MEINLKLSENFNNTFFLDCLKNEKHDLIEKILNIGSEICQNNQIISDPDLFFFSKNQNFINNNFENEHLNSKYNKIFNKLYKINDFNDFFKYISKSFRFSRKLINSFDESIPQNCILFGMDSFNNLIGTTRKNCFIKFCDKDISCTELDNFYSFIDINKEKMDIYGALIFCSDFFSIGNKGIIFDIEYKNNIPIMLVNEINQGCAIIQYCIMFMWSLIDLKQQKTDKNEELDKVLEKMLEILNELKMQSSNNEKEKNIIENLLISYNEKNNNLKNQIELIKKTLSSQPNFLIDKKDSVQEINEGFNKLINIIYEEISNNPNFVISLNSISELQKFKDNNFSYNQLKNWGIKNIKNEISKLKELGK